MMFKNILSYYANVSTKPALERLKGIDQKQLHHYATGLKRPQEPQRKKIENALHKFCRIQFPVNSDIADQSPEESGNPDPCFPD